jgi:hypothetical protein
MSDKKVSRRQALGRVGAPVAETAAGSRLARQTRGPASAQTQAPRLAPRDELVNAPEFEEEAKKKLAAAQLRDGGGRRPLHVRPDHLRGRVLAPAVEMDLSQDDSRRHALRPIIVETGGRPEALSSRWELATARLGAT